MNAADVMRALARGERPGDRLLGACRLEWAGAEAFGEEAILELFAAAPLDLAGAQAVETATGCALIADDVALVADLYGGRIGRLWRIGAGEPPGVEPIVAVAFDPDLRQERGGIYLRVEDHPDLAADALPRVTAAGEALIDRRNLVAHRARAFAVRVFSAGERTAALFAVHHLSTGAVRQAGFAYAAALIAGDMRLVRDQRPLRDWTPRL